jgi:hypothetical protein
MGYPSDVDCAFEIDFIATTGSWLAIVRCDASLESRHSLGFPEVTGTGGLVTVAFDTSLLRSKAFQVVLASSDESFKS